jgi:hypothetical protein
MSDLFKGLNLLIADNELHRKPLDQQAAYWLSKTDRGIEHEIHLLDVAKGQWLAGSVIVWLGASLTALAIIADNLWEHSYNPSFAKIILVLLIWVAMLFVLWLIAQIFDQKAGFSRWVTAFSSREPVTSESDSVEQVQEALEYARTYPEILDYKQRVVARRPLRHEDIRIMREMGRQRRHAELARELTQLGSTG